METLFALKMDYFKHGHLQIGNMQLRNLRAQLKVANRPTCVRNVKTERDEA